MAIAAARVDLAAIEPLRSLFLQEANVQWVHHAFHERGWSDPYLLTLDGATIGYGTRSKREPCRLFEFYLLPGHQRLANEAFAALIVASGAQCVEAQTNVALLASMLFEHCREIEAQYVLFADGVATDQPNPEVHFRPAAEDGEYVLEREGAIVAKGGFLCHYNAPFADLWMEVEETYRGRGLGTYILQELKRECRLAGRVPAARCRVANRASKATLTKAGMRPVGYLMTGKISP